MPTSRPPSCTRTYPIRAADRCTTRRIPMRSAGHPDEGPTMLLHLNPTVLLAVTTCAGFMMTRAGLEKKMIEVKRRRRTCPSCGRHLQANTCACNA